MDALMHGVRRLTRWGLWLGGAVSTSQLFSAASIAVGLFFLVRGRIGVARAA